LYTVGLTASARSSRRLCRYGKASAGQARAAAKQLKPQTPEAGAIGDKVAALSEGKAALLRDLSGGNLRVLVTAGGEPAKSAV
jgi:hypothetical protein